MSTVPANTSTRPSGFSLTHAWLGSPFWFIPVGYSIVVNPRPLCFAISGLPFSRTCWETEMLGQELAARGSLVIARYPAPQLDAAPRRRPPGPWARSTDRCSTTRFALVSPIRFAFFSRNS